jgi:hypothetical protein
MMKRPKIKDMNKDQLVRFRLLQGRRAAQRSLFMLEHIDESMLTKEDLTRLDANMNKLRSIIAVTKPKHVRTAPLSELIPTLEYLSVGDDTRALT